MCLVLTVSVDRAGLQPTGGGLLALYLLPFIPIEIRLVGPIRSNAVDGP